MLDKKNVSVPQRDPTREFRGKIREVLKLETGGECSHPLCDLNENLEGHHVIHHARGGPTKPWNGLLLCKVCHFLAHSVPVSALWSIKCRLRDSTTDNSSPTGIQCADDAVVRIMSAMADSTARRTAFQRINAVLANAFYLPTPAARHVAFMHGLLAKAVILNDRTPSVRSTLETTLSSMNERRLHAQLLAARAARHARSIGDRAFAIRALHTRAVAFNARNRFRASAAAHGEILKELRERSRARTDQVDLFMARLLRERAVCLAKASSRSTKARDLVAESLRIAKAIGSHHDVSDALLRCCETMTFLERYGDAHAHRDELRANWSRLDPHLRAIAMKLEARLLIATRKRALAEEAVAEGKKWCEQHRFHHQSYHFARLAWQLCASRILDRRVYMT